MKIARAKRAKLLFSIVKYANLRGFCCRRCRGFLSSPLTLIRDRTKTIHVTNERLAHFLSPKIKTDSIWDESLLLSNCARSLEYSSSSTLAGLSYHICGKLEVAFKGSPSSQHQHCTDEAQKAKTVRFSASFAFCRFLIRSDGCRCWGSLDYSTRRKTR